MSTDPAAVRYAMAVSAGDSLCWSCHGGGRVSWDGRPGPCPECWEGCQSMGLPVRFSSAILEGFPHAALTQLLSWNYRAPGWFIHGPVGTGKTHAMAALCRTAARRGLRPRFITAAGFLEARRAAFDGKDGVDIVQQLLEANLVALDDLGNERGGEPITPWAVGELHELIDRFYGAEKVLVVTANLSLRELAGALGDRLASRIAGLTRPLALGGTDRRLEVVK